MTSEQTIRVFAAIDPPEEVLREVERIQHRLRKLFVGVVHWTRPEGIHLTLKFFGNVDMSRVEGLEKRLAQYARESAPLQLRVEGIGAFPNWDRPRVVWIGIGGDTRPLKRLQKRIAAGSTELGFERESRPFRPHLTLGRVKTLRGLPGLAEVTGNDALNDAGRFTARDLSLIKSDLTPTGAVYTKLSCIPLQGT